MGPFIMSPMNITSCFPSGIKTTFYKATKLSAHFCVFNISKTLASFCLSNQRLPKSFFLIKIHIPLGRKPRTLHVVKNKNSNTPLPPLHQLPFLIGSQFLNMAPMTYTVGHVICSEWSQLSSDLGLRTCSCHCQGWRRGGGARRGAL